MRLRDLLLSFERRRFPDRDAPERPPREAVRAVQDAVAIGLRDPDFCLDCLEADAAAGTGRGVEEALVPFAADEERGIRLALGHWAPGTAAGPHEHADWTVTAVVFNALAVRTFDYDVAARAGRLAPKSHFDAPAGKVGHIYEPCVHEPYNPTDAWSISLHVLGPAHGATLQARGVRVEGLDSAPRPTSEPTPLDRALDALRSDRVRRARAGALDRWPGDRARGLLLDAFRSSGPAARGAIADRLARTYGVDAWRASHLAPPAPLSLDTDVEMAWPGVALGVVTQDGTTALVASSGDRSCTLVRAASRAEAALSYVATRGRFAIGALPGDLSSREKMRLAAALVEWSAFHAVPSRNEEKTDDVDHRARP